MGCIYEIQPEVGSDPDEIIPTLERLRGLVEHYCPDRCGAFKHMVTGALAVYRLRLVDVSLREEVMLLHLIEGGSESVLTMVSVTSMASMAPGTCTRV